MSTLIPDDLKDAHAQLVADSSRASKADSQTYATATELLISQFSADSLQKIRHVVEGFQSLNEDQQKKILPNDQIGYELTELMSSVCYDLMQMYDEASYPPDFERRKAIPWSHGENGAREHFRPFIRTVIKTHPYWSNKIQDWVYWDNEKMGWTEMEWVNCVLKADPCDDFEISRQNSYFSWLHNDTRGGTVAQRCLGVKSQFVFYMIPKIAQISRLIRENYVDAVTWESALVAYRGGGNKDASGSASKY